MSEQPNKLENFFLPLEWVPADYRRQFILEDAGHGARIEIVVAGQPRAGLTMIQHPPLRRARGQCRNGDVLDWIQESVEMVREELGRNG